MKPPEGYSTCGLPSDTRHSLIISWHEQTPALHAWLGRYPATLPLSPRRGREADTWQLGIGETPAFVVKRWQHPHSVDASAQYQLLHQLAAAGIPVTPAAGWGIDGDGCAILATKFAGEPMDPRQAWQIEAFAEILARVHALPSQDRRLPLPTRRTPAGSRIEDIVARDMQGVTEFADILAILGSLHDSSHHEDATFVHGDYHPGNAMLGARGLRIGDWSDAGMGRRAYDLAWAGVLLWIYSGEQAYECFIGAYRSASRWPLDPAELRRFEIIAGLRWLLLARRSPFPIEPETQQACLRFLNERLPPEVPGFKFQVPGGLP